MGPSRCGVPHRPRTSLKHYVTRDLRLHLWPSWDMSWSQVGRINKLKFGICDACLPNPCMRTFARGGFRLAWTCRSGVAFWESDTAVTPHFGTTVARRSTRIRTCTMLCPVGRYQPCDSGHLRMCVALDIRMACRPLSYPDRESPIWTRMNTIPTPTRIGNRPENQKSGR